MIITGPTTAEPVDLALQFAFLIFCPGRCDYGWG